MSRKERKITHRRRVELRRAALRRWRTDDRLDTVAERIGVPIGHVAQALRPVIDSVALSYRPGCTVADVALDRGLPGDFVAYCFRWFSAAARARRG